MKINFDHISLRAKNPSEMKNFLIELLDFEIGFRPDFPFEGYWLYSGKKDVVHIFNEQATFYKKGLIKENIEEESTGKNIVNHVCFYSDDYEELMARIRKMNLDYSINLVPDCSIEQIFINAPENLILEIQAIPKDKKE
ncbi:hypothetical protein [Poseidonibacter ostreae]|uniref:VOC domain-containing protein n=1 Tax=Poseidonibacter ostreae TaxID=2654171 RepID=A0A6L4WTZ8_9BACT|nr:hypothetical protein [Poseidonibacter ostreae]KAB7888854.1 hypothetical protein GBG18_12115 [Poseidonibacter ostreae]KAB7889655.1 hypothetical protein GBG19_05455 [Poseidonibacter ostreae]